MQKNRKNVDLLVKIDFSISGPANQLFSTFFDFFCIFLGKMQKQVDKKVDLPVQKSKKKLSLMSNSTFLDFFCICLGKIKKNAKKNIGKNSLKS